jgi:uncharacterized protein YlzI (FlbEa/FlbD family)
MSKFIELTGVDSGTVLINTRNIVYLQPVKDGTHVLFIDGKAKNVKESYDEIKKTLEDS